MHHNNITASVGKADRMSELKSSFMGGYSRKSVDSYIEELQNENELLKNQLDIAEQEAMKADKYLNENGQLTNEINRLNEKVSELESKLRESEKSNSDYIANIGKIFYSAYESGAKITEDAKNGSQEFLKKISDDTYNAKMQIKKAVESYNNINGEIKSLMTNLSTKLNEVSQSSDDLIKKATMIAQEMDGIEAVQIANENKAKQTQDEYREFFNSFNAKNHDTSVVTLPVYSMSDICAKKAAHSMDEAQSIIDDIHKKDNDDIKQRAEEIKNISVFNNNSNHPDEKNQNESKSDKADEMREALKQISK